MGKAVQKYAYAVGRVFVKNREGHILMTRRGEGHSSAGKLVLPGGKIDLEVEVEQTLIDEIPKETGILIRDVGLLFIQSDLPVPESPHHVVNIYARATPYGRKLKPGPEEAEVFWADIFNLDPREMVFGTEAAIRFYLGLRPDPLIFGAFQEPMHGVGEYTLASLPDRL